MGGGGGGGSGGGGGGWKDGRITQARKVCYFTGVDFSFVISNDNDFLITLLLRLFHI